MSVSLTHKESVKISFRDWQASVNNSHTCQEIEHMHAYFRSTWVAVIGIAGIAILSAALFAALHGRAVVACAL
jgi:hypothetical protein